MRRKVSTTIFISRAPLSLRHLVQMLQFILIYWNLYRILHGIYLLVIDVENQVL